MLINTGINKVHKKHELTVMVITIFGSFMNSRIYTMWNCAKSCYALEVLLMLAAGGLSRMCSCFSNIMLYDDRI